MYGHKHYGSPVSSVVEHQTFNLRVTGSNPILGVRMYVRIHKIFAVLAFNNIGARGIIVYTVYLEM